MLDKSLEPNRFNTEREREKFRSTAMELMQKNHKWPAKIKAAIIFYI